MAQVIHRGMIYARWSVRHDTVTLIHRSANDRVGVLIQAEEFCDLAQHQLINDASLSNSLWISCSSLPMFQVCSFAGNKITTRQARKMAKKARRVIESRDYRSRVLEQISNRGRQ